MNNYYNIIIITGNPKWQIYCKSNIYNKLMQNIKFTK